MIKINLLGDDTVVDYTGYAVLAGYGASLVVALLVMFVLAGSLSSSVNDMSLEVESLETRLEQLKKTNKEVRDLEKKKKDLKMKLATLAQLKKNKSGPVRVLDDLNLAMPEQAWLAKVKETNNVFRIEGFALDDSTVANLMKALEESKYFGQVELVETRQQAKGGVKIKYFILKAEVYYAGIKIELDEEEDKNKKGKRRK